jgi:hypothetical protein
MSRIEFKDKSPYRRSQRGALHLILSEGTVLTDWLFDSFVQKKNLLLGGIMGKGKNRRLILDAVLRIQNYSSDDVR